MTMAQQSFSCTRCNNSIIIASGQYTCNTCGLVHGPEMAEPKHTEERHYSGSRLNIVDGLGSYLGYHNGPSLRDIKGSILPAEIRYKFLRLKRNYEFSTKFYKAETMFRTLSALNRVKSILDLNKSLVHRAAYLYRKYVFIQASKEIKITMSPVAVAACLLIAIREVNAPYRLQEISQIFHQLGYKISSRTLTRRLYEISVILKIPYQRAQCSDFLIRVLTEAIQYPGFIEIMKIYKIDPCSYQRELLELCLKALAYLKGKLRRSVNPFILAISLTYYMDRLYCRGRFNYKTRRQVFHQQQLGKLFTCAEYSIRDHCKKLKTIIPNLEVLDEQC